MAGDQRAFAVLVDRLEGRVFRFIVRHIPDPVDAEDLTQDTFVEVFRKLSTFRGGSKLSTWVLGVALNIARNHRNRAPKHRYDWSDESALDKMNDGTPDPHAQAETLAFARAAEDALARLTPELREAVVLVSIEGLGYDEAAEIAGAPVGTMKNRVFRARRAMRAYLEETGRGHLLDP